MGEILGQIGEVLDTHLFVIGETTVTVSTLAMSVLIFLVAVLFSRLIRKLVERVLLARGGKPGVVGTISGLLHYMTLIIGFGIALDTAGIDLTALFAAGAIFAVGLGFAMQSIAQNFVAGVILLTERAIKPGDILEVDGQIVKIMDMGIRASIGQTRDGEDLIIPNSTLIQNAVKNYTLKASTFRVRIGVGVTYASDMKIVRETLEGVATEIAGEWGVTDESSQVIMVGFGDNSVNWEVAVWMSDPWSLRAATSALLEGVWFAFRDEEIVIAFPQLDVHFDRSVTEGLSKLAAAS